MLDTKSTSATLGLPNRSGPLLPFQSATLAPAGRGGIPNNADTVVLGLSATDTTMAVGALVTYPTGSPPILTGLNYRIGTNVESTVPSTLGADGTMSFLNFATTSVNLLGDVYGYYR